VLDKTHGQVLYADQLVELVKLLGFDHAWAERFRRAIAGGRATGRDLMERAIREAGARQRWTTEQSNVLIALLIQHVLAAALFEKVLAAFPGDEGRRPSQGKSHTAPRPSTRYARCGRAGGQL